MQPTRLLVRVQAKGGKFLGPDAGYSRVTLRDAASGAVLAQGIAEGGSGQLTGSFSPAATRQSIVTPMWGTQNVLWLSATPGQPTAGLTATLDLDAPTLVEFTAEALTDGAPNGHTATQTMWITPGADLTAEPGVVLVMPGLNVRVLSATPTPGAPSVSVTAWVSMMCGCKIDPTLPWLPTEFAVSAVVTDASGAVVAQAPLAFQATSTFGTAQPIPLPGPGTYVVAVDAVQAAEANVGSASSTLSVTGGS
ncbi:MAG TPA: hypothetical protein VFR81_09095 [Longimicrobium sp.]|nr:hypothetical protein [Longimicrobium sp.]